MGSLCTSGSGCEGLQLRDNTAARPAWGMEAARSQEQLYESAFSELRAIAGTLAVQVAG